jgi:hypothetical protein
VVEVVKSSNTEAHAVRPRRLCLSSAGLQTLNYYSYIDKRMKLACHFVCLCMFFTCVVILPCS